MGNTFVNKKKNQNYKQMTTLVVLHCDNCKCAQKVPLDGAPIGERIKNEIIFSLSVGMSAPVVNITCDSCLVNK